MYKAKILYREVVEEGVPLSVRMIELNNSYIVLLSEGVENLGTLAVSIPSRREISRLPLSSVLLGERNRMIARLVAERLAALTGKIALVSVFIKTLDEAKAGRIFIRLLEKILREGEKPGEP